jgi:hypothetical protein
VRVEEIGLPFVVVAVLYPLAGNESSIQYGGQWTEPILGATYSLTPVGSRWRALLRTADGAETVARVLPVEGSEGDTGSWRLAAVTPATVALTSSPQGLLARSFQRDVPTHAVDDEIAVWVNPRASIATDFVGGRTIRWSASESLPECDPYYPVRVAWLTPAQLEGAAPTLDPCGQAFLASLDEAQRTEIAAYDAFYSPPGREPQAFFDDPRLVTVENMSISYRHQRSGTVSWWCEAPLADETSPGFARSEVPLASGETLVVEHTFLATDTSCTPRSFGSFLGTSTEDCEVSSALVLDSMFGTALMVAGTQWDWSGTAACTR